MANINFNFRSADMLQRTLAKVIQTYQKEYPILAIVGPRQSGKTTLVRQLFRQYTYLSLENADLRRQAITDPRAFLNDYGNHLILDEIQRTPELFSFLQQKVDEDPSPAQYILTGSQQFLLMEKITQSLAGRIAIFKLFPLTWWEILQQQIQESAGSLLALEPKKIDLKPFTYDLVFKGCYPKIHAEQVTPRKWLENYISTYIERDVRLLINVKDLRTFEQFLKMTAAYSGQLVNYAAIATQVGVSQPTIKQWLSILEASGIIFLLPPFHHNFTKRLVKTPKLYFVDTGILCYLLDIRDPTSLPRYPFYGAIFETWVISHFHKRFAHAGERPPLYFWRDRSGHEVDLLIDGGLTLTPIEIKAAKTWQDSFTQSIEKWMELVKPPYGSPVKGWVLYDGELTGKEKKVTGCPWWRL